MILGSSRTVIYLARHSEEGALGFVINVPMGEVPFERALKPLGARGATGERRFTGPLRRTGRAAPRLRPAHAGLEGRRHDGGRRRFASHPGREDPGIDGRWHRATTGPVCPRVCGMGAGPLDAELTTGGWGIAAADERLVFEMDPAQKWIEAMARRILEL